MVAGAGPVAGLPGEGAELKAGVGLPGPIAEVGVQVQGANEVLLASVKVAPIECEVAEPPTGAGLPERVVELREQVQGGVEVTLGAVEVTLPVCFDALLKVVDGLLEWVAVVAGHVAPVVRVVWWCRAACHTVAARRWWVTC